jgi:hypothetical protein
MAERIHALGGIPLREFTEEDYRLSLGQQRALGTLVPLTLDLLEADPFAEGGPLPGDLLVTITRISTEFGRQTLTCGPMERKVVRALRRGPAADLPVVRLLEC